MYFYVYRITCIEDQSREKYYYGYRSCKVDPLVDPYMSSSKYVKEAIGKYGSNKFVKKIICVFDSREKALAMEIRLHDKFDVANNPLFFNRAKASEFGFKVSAAYTKGKTYEEIHGKEFASKLRSIRSETMTEYSKVRNYSKDHNPNFGNRWSAEQKKALSEKVSGVNSKTRGSFWVTNGSINIKLKKGSTVPDGMRKGRTNTSNPPKHTGMKWYNNGTVNIVRNPNDVPDGFVPGKVLNKKDVLAA